MADELIIVTPEHLKLGWLEKDGMFIRERKYQVIRRLEDGNYVVVAPTYTNQESRGAAQESGRMNILKGDN